MPGVSRESGDVNKAHAIKYNYYFSSKFWPIGAQFCSLNEFKPYLLISLHLDYLIIIRNHKLIGSIPIVDTWPIFPTTRYAHSVFAFILHQLLKPRFQFQMNEFETSNSIVNFHVRFQMRREFGPGRALNVPPASFGQFEYQLQWSKATINNIN